MNKLPMSPESEKYFESLVDGLKVGPDVVEPGLHEGLLEGAEETLE